MWQYLCRYWAGFHFLDELLQEIKLSVASKQTSNINRQAGLLKKFFHGFLFLKALQYTYCAFCF